MQSKKIKNKITIQKGFIVFNLQKNLIALYLGFFNIYIIIIFLKNTLSYFFLPYTYFLMI